MEIEDKIKEEIEKIRPFLMGDGGDIEFIKFEDGIEEILINEIPEVKGVVNDTEQQ